MWQSERFHTPLPHRLNYLANLDLALAPPTHDALTGAPLPTGHVSQQATPRKAQNPIGTKPKRSGRLVS